MLLGKHEDFLPDLPTAASGSVKTSDSSADVVEISSEESATDANVQEGEMLFFLRRLLAMMH